MDVGGSTVEAFRFLDVRGPKPRDGGAAATYVVTRSMLGFPRTEFEQVLLDSSGNDNYISALRAAVQDQKGIKEYPGSGGYAVHLSAYEEILTRGGMSPEDTRVEFKLILEQHLSNGSIAEYLTNPAQNAWDWYLLCVITKHLGISDVDPSKFSHLARALRVAAAIYEIGRDTDSSLTANSINTTIDIRQLILSSIHIERDLFDPKAVKDQTEKVPLAEPSTEAREAQNELVREVIQLELAASELRNQLLSRTAIFTSTANPVPVLAGTGNDEAAGQLAGNLVVSFPKARLSQTTIDLLVKRYGGTDGGNNVDNLEIGSVMSRIGLDLNSSGAKLFGQGSQSAIAAFSNQHILLTKKMSESSDLPEKTLSELPLLLSVPIYDRPEQHQKPLGGSVRPLGVGDLKVVKQNLLRYEAGEVAHVENVLQGQSKDRTHSVKQRTEESITVEQERTTSSERDLQSTDRFEIKEESTQALLEKRQNEAGVTVTASYGAVSVTGSTKFSDVASSEQSQKLARSFAREVIERSVSKVQHRVREERIRKTTLDVEETNKYTLVAKEKNVVGVYRWVEKVYWAQVHVYGKRLMLEFMVPEPATLYVHAQGRGSPDPAAVSPPEPLIISAHHLQRYNYSSIAAKYGAEVSIPPPLARSVRLAGRTEKDSAATSVQVEDDFIGIAGAVSYAGWGPKGAVTRILLGTNMWNSQNPTWYTQYFSGGVVGNVPLMVSTNLTSFSAAAEVLCVPSEQAFEKWQLETYKAIVAARQVRQSEYEEYISLRRKAEVPVNSAPDAENRSVERRELQRACIEMLSEQHFSALGAIKENAASGWPEIDFPAAGLQGRYAAFFQQSFEWDQITYVFYPYYWSRQSEWGRQISANGGDALFSQFLSAGYARVVVPVRPSHENDVLYFLEAGQVWGGTEPPVLGDSDFVSIIDEIKESLDAPDSGVPEGNPWQFRVPTSLIILDPDGKLPEWPINLPSPTTFIPSKETCGGVPYNAHQWKDGKSKADAVRALGYDLASKGDQDAVISAAKGTVRALQMRFNDLGVSTVLGRSLKVDGILGPCTLRALTYFDALRAAGKWPGAL